MITTQGSLTFVGLNTSTPQVFWNGNPVPNIMGIQVDWEEDSPRVKLKVAHIDLDIQAAMLSNNIIIKKGSK